jgi:hypothetical protein
MLALLYTHTCVCSIRCVLLTFELYFEFSFLILQLFISSFSIIKRESAVFALRVTPGI